MEKIRVTKEMIEEKFSRDPLFLSISFTDELKDKLFPDFLWELYVDDQYSTKKAADLFSKILDKGSDNNIRYYMRSSNLEDYIQPLQSGRNYRLLYTSVYKIYLIFLFLSHPNDSRNLNDIKGLLPEYNVQPFAKGRSKGNVVNDTGVEKQRLDEDYYEAAMMSLIYGKQNKEAIQQVGDFAAEFWNDFISTVQILQKTNQNIDGTLLLTKKIIKETNELHNLENDLTNLKNTLRNDAQFSNIQKMYKELNASKKESDSFFGRLFAKKKNIEVTEIEFSKVTGEEPAVLDLQNKIKDKKSDIVKLETKLNLKLNERKNILDQQVIPDKTRLEILQKAMILLEEPPLLNEQSNIVTQNKETDDTRPSVETKQIIDGIIDIDAE